MQIPHQIKLLALCILVIFLLPINAFADAAPTSSPSMTFKTGVTLFQKQDYTNALASFYQAKELGFDKPALMYNIGVCHYKLGHYGEAEEAFIITASNPKMAPIAFYNLALVAMARGNNDKALSLLSKVINSTSDIKLHSLARNAMDHIKETQKNKLFAYGSVGVGYDDNVILTAASDSISGSGKEDGFTEFTAFTGGPFLGGTYQNGMQFQAGGYFLKYFDLSSYDTSAINLGTSYRKKISAWRVEGGGNYTFTLLDGEKLEQVPTVDLIAMYTFQTKQSLRFHYQLGYFDMLHPDYDYLAGWRHWANAAFVLPVNKTKLRFGYTLEVNDRDDSESSPTRHQVEANIEYYPTTKLVLYGSAAYRKSSYDMSTTLDRSDDQYTCIGRLRFILANRWELNGEYRYTDNQSNYIAYDYQRNLFQLTLGRNF
jgi:tetratricopeptide (TPR) repeat protein